MKLPPGELGCQSQSLLKYISLPFCKIRNNPSPPCYLLDSPANKYSRV